MRHFVYERMSKHIIYNFGFVLFVHFLCSIFHISGVTVTSNCHWFSIFIILLIRGQRSLNIFFKIVSNVILLLYFNFKCKSFFYSPPLKLCPGSSVGAPKLWVLLNGTNRKKITSKVISAFNASHFQYSCVMCNPVNAHSIRKCLINLNGNVVLSAF